MNDNFNNGKLYKMHKDINDVLYIGTTLKKCLFKFKKESTVKRNWLNNKCYNMIYFNSVNIELIENFLYDNANTLKCKKTK